MRIYDHEDYKDFVTIYLAQLGRGQKIRLAQALKITPTRLSLILNGPVDFTPEQASKVCEHFKLGELETDYFLNLVFLSRAGTQKLKTYHLARLKRIRTKAQQLVSRATSAQNVLNEEDRLVFYSSWLYSAIHLATFIPELRTPEALASRFQISRSRAQKILDFLVSRGLCIASAEGPKPGVTTTHLESSHPMIARHHSSWRLRAMDKHENITSNEMAFTCQVAVSEGDLFKIREELAQVVERFYKTVEKSAPEEKLACLNIDWFEL